MADINERFQLIPALKLKQNSTIFDAIHLINNRYGMIVTIVDEGERLAGIVSQGDLSQAILNGNSVNTQLRYVMNRKPIYISAKELEGPSGIDTSIIQNLKKRYDNTSLLYAMVPVITDDKQVSGLISLESLTTYLTVPKVKLNYRTALIVGGAGYIGSILTRRLLDEGWSVRVLDKLLYTEDSLSGLDQKRFSLIRGDAGIIDDIVKSVEGVDAVIYLAELVGDPACSIAPQSTLKTNYLAVTAMAHLCSHLNINRFIYTSSCSVYGASGGRSDLLMENSAIRPVSLYGRMKVLVEEAILSVCRLPNPLFAPTILRLATVFGHSYRPRFDLVVNTFVKNALQRGVIEIFGGDQWRPNIHVRDVAEAVIKVLNAPIEKIKGGIFNIGANELNHTINELADITKEVFPHIRIVKKDKAVDHRNYRVDFTKFEKAVGFKAKIGVREGMLELKNAFELNMITNLNDSRYSNLERLKELNLV